MLLTTQAAFHMGPSWARLGPTGAHLGMLQQGLKKVLFFYIILIYVYSKSIEQLLKKIKGYLKQGS